MTATASRLAQRAPARPAASPTAGHGAPPPRPAPLPQRVGVSEDVLTLALALLCLAAVVPIRRVFIGGTWIRPVAGAVLLAVAIGWCARRLRVGPITHLLMSGASLLVFCTIAFVPTTAIAGLLPTWATVGALQDLFVRGLELVELRPSPTFAEAGLLLLAVSGVWLMTYLADGLLFVLGSPTKAVVAALVTWSVPLAVAPPSEGLVGLPVVGLLAAAVMLLLLGAATETGRFGPAVPAPGPDGRPRPPRAVPWAGWLVGAAAVAVGVLLAPLLPGFGAEALVTPRGGSGTTITTNPIVDIRNRLVAGDGGPVVLVSSPRPLYLRTTALDRYDADEQWTAGTISGQRVQGVVDTPPPIPREPVEVQLTIGASIESGAVLAPAPYQPVEVSGEKAADLRYDRRSATLTAPGEAPLVPGDTYTVVAAVPDPDVAALRSVPIPVTGSALTALPPDVPAEVVALARQITADAGAVTMFDAALAIQDHLRGWSYSTTPEPGLGATALLRFIDAREGYCEQFAGTMAVMLRTLGIPSRVAVGYTPGTLAEDGVWRVTNANAHAWVEVDFGQYGWVAFEPTPRTDGNVLVTGADTVVPAETVAQADGREPSTAEPAGPGELADVVPSEQPIDRGAAEEDPGVPGEATAVEGAADDGPPWGLVLLALLGVAGAGVLVVRRRAADGPPADPVTRIADARLRVERTGRAVGVPRQPSETDGEYLGRLAGGHRAGAVLARPATRAVYAPAVTAAEAGQAEDAAVALARRLTDDLPSWRRAVVAVRVRAAALRAAS